MLLELNIKKFAIIEDINIRFTKGLNILTGETGSGKSIIIEALGIILGGRGTKNLIQKGSEKATLQALFVVNKDNDKILKILNDYGIDLDSDNLLLFTREIFVDSPSISRINGRTVTLNVLKDISSNLIDIFAQQEHQSLLDIRNHREIIDLFGDEELVYLKKEVANKYLDYKALIDELSKINIDPIQREREMELLKYQLDEINEANIDIENDKNIDEEYLKCTNISTIVEQLGYISTLLKNDNYDEPSATKLINIATNKMKDVKESDKSTGEIYNRLESLDLELNDIYKEVIHYLESVDINEERQFYILERFDLLNTLKKKYGNTLESVLEYKNIIELELDRLINHETYIYSLDKKILEQEEYLLEISNDLKDRRMIIAKFLEAEISKELSQLNMPDVEFIVDFKSKLKPSYHGIEDIEFLISTNIGTDLKPLSEIVSGGEMSRIMLGFKSILAQHDNIETMIFDEIDTGISGRTAQIVGEKIYKISKTKQVITITHLPQIAALADTHFVIDKSKHNDRVITDINRLDNEDRVVEMARLLGGVDLTENTIIHAREMLEMSSKFRNL